MSTSEVTRILNAIERGESQAAGQLLPLVNDELRKLAAARQFVGAQTHTRRAAWFCLSRTKRSSQTAIAWDCRLPM
jgi:ECF sigma factor